ncbi:MAG TPA: alanine racemase [Gemmatimonadota bacterium]|nr:alanine racemase [Gemmatimonadota bacterium]
MLRVPDLPTPALLVDLDVLERNLARMQAKCDRLGVALRPHVKTHKCVEIGRLQREAGARGITVATLEEARAFAEAGFDDLTWAFPVVPGRIDEAREIAGRSTLRLLVDSDEAVDALERAAFPFRVWLKVDCGYHRAGVDPASDAAVSLARRLAESPTLGFDGILTHSGHAYLVSSRAELAAVAAQERDAVVAFAERLRADGVEVPSISVGSSPAMSAVERLDGVDEARPGNYAYNDWTQVLLGACEVADCALTVAATVVSTAADHAVVDAGALALSKDAGRPDLAAATMGEIFEDHAGGRLREDVRLVALSQEHGKTSGRLPVGERVRILPNHSCLTAACFDRVHAVRGEEVVGAWRVRRER